MQNLHKYKLYNKLTYAQLYYLFYFALFIFYGFSFFYFIFVDMSHVAETGVLSKETNIIDLHMDWDIQNIFVEREKQKLVDLLDK